MSESSTARSILFVPDTETSLDLLYFEPIAAALTTLIDETSKQPVTIGIHGDWGAGKSSIMKMVQARFKDRKDVLVIHFDGWRFQGFDDAKTVLLETIVAQLLASETFGSKIKHEAVVLLKRIKWLKVAKRAGELGWNVVAGLPAPSQIKDIVGGLSAMRSDQSADAKGTGISGEADGVSEYLSDRTNESVARSVQEFASDFQKLLEKTGLKKLVVLIDDLDRCLPNTTIETLEAIRLFLFVEKTAFVIAADEGMIEYAVRHHFPDLPNSTSATSYARNYLEKLIQTPLRLSPLGVEEAKMYVTLLLVQGVSGDEHQGFKDLVTKALSLIRQPWISADLKLDDVLAVDPGRAQELTAAYQLALQIGRTVAEGTSGNPRQIKRFLNAMAVRQAIAQARGLEDVIQRDILAKLMLAERFRPDVYDKIAVTALASPTGTVPELKILEALSAHSADEDDLPDDWRDDAWLLSWGKIEPALATVDLRPYVFVARDKRVQFGRASTTESIDGILSALAGGPIALAGAEPQLKALMPAEVETLFDTWQNDLLAAPSLSGKPRAFDGLCRLAELHPVVRERFVALLATVDVENLGFWVCAGWRPESWPDGPARVKAVDLLRKWSTNKTNSSLKTAAGPLFKKVKPV